ncbi:MAG: DUF397 domain-containing protein [Trebonia sp.]
MEINSTDWRKSSYSSATGNQCVEAGNGRASVLIRDTTDRNGVTLSITAGAWQEFTAALK